MIHELKCIPEYFEAVASGDKTFEVRKNDRPFAVSDFIALNEYRADTGYTGRCALLEITYILDNPDYCKDGLVTLGLSPCRITMKNHMYTGEELYNGGVPVYGRKGV